MKLLKEEKLDDFDLFFEDLTPQDFLSYNTLRIAEVLPQEECQILIFDEIKKSIDLPNYYQIKSFIDVLATQFKQFNRNHYINAALLNMFKTDKSIRTFIIESYIKLTKHFTKGAFNELIESREDQKLDIKEGIKKLSEIKTNLISFDKFDYSLIFFYEGTGELFSIISNLPSIVNQSNKNEDEKYYAKVEYDKLKKLLNFNTLKDMKQRDLPDFKKYKQVDFLQELKDILDLKNHVRNEDKIKDMNDLIKMMEEKKENESAITEIKESIEALNNRPSLEEIVGKYVFTPDNFIKMILILLRIRANIPVIMMGETGCGKTSLIKMLFKLLNNGSLEEMKVLNIHAGITDNDIIKFLKEKNDKTQKSIIEEAKEIEEEDEKEAEERKQIGQIYAKRKIWIFLDEINTCKSMGLISELMCKHTIQGDPIPSNIVFIAACNPYRFNKEGIVNVGLDIKNAVKEKKHLNDKDLERLARNETAN